MQNLQEYSKKKIAQTARREARRVYQQVAIELKTKIVVINNCLKPRPKWLPKKIWRLMATRFIDLKGIESVLNDQTIQKILSNY